MTRFSAAENLGSAVVDGREGPSLPGHPTDLEAWCRPLAPGHRDDAEDLFYACELPEHAPEFGKHAYDAGCRRCVIGWAALTVHHPDTLHHDGDRGPLRPAITILRNHLDEFDPLRVLVERELARRGPHNAA